jgi:hypothetical protein
MGIQVEQAEQLTPLVGEQLHPLVELIDPDEPHRPHRRITIVERKRMQRIIIDVEVYRRQLGTPQRSLNTRQAHALHFGDSPEAVAFGPQPGHRVVPVMHQAEPHSTMFAYPTAKPVYRHAKAISAWNRYSQQTWLKSPNPLVFGAFPLHRGRLEAMLWRVFRLQVDHPVAAHDDGAPSTVWLLVEHVHVAVLEPDLEGVALDFFGGPTPSRRPIPYSPFSTTFNPVTRMCEWAWGRYWDPGLQTCQSPLPHGYPGYG